VRSSPNLGAAACLLYLLKEQGKFNNLSRENLPWFKINFQKQENTEKSKMIICRQKSFIKSLIPVFKSNTL
jgi:hypothetical protein